MKEKMHPELHEVKVHCACGNEFMTRSTKKDMRVEICSNCHPFYTGKQKMIDSAGRIERFTSRYASVVGGARKSRKAVKETAKSE